MSGEAAPVPENYLTLPFADGDYLFRLPAGQIAELQQKCDAGIGLVFARMCAGRFVDREGDLCLNPTLAQFKYEDVVETIRLALIGGGQGVVDEQPVKVDPVKALALVRNYVHPRPIMESWRIAYAILAAFTIGYVDPDAAQKKRDQESTSQETEPVKDGSTFQ